MAKTKRLGTTTCLPPGLFVSSSIFERGFYLDRGFIWYRHDFWIELKSRLFSPWLLLLYLHAFILLCTVDGAKIYAFLLTIVLAILIISSMFKRIISPRVAFDLENREIIDYFSDRYPFSMNFDGIATLGVMRNTKNRFDPIVGVFAESFSGDIFWVTIFYRKTEDVLLDEYLNGLKVIIGTKAKIENRDFDGRFSTLGRYISSVR